MGCTSSAPNMPSHTNSEHELAFKNEDMEEKLDKELSECNNKKEMDMNGIKVLPTCDTLEELIQLDRNNKSLDNSTPPPVSEKDINNGIYTESGDSSTQNDQDTENSNSEEKLSTLEEVVEKVVELYTDNAISKTQSEISRIDTKPEVTDKADETKELPENDDTEEKHSGEENEEAAAEAMASPSESASSRATRWEALADVAAELPPSLAVDPVTGQIYAVSK